MMESAPKNDPTPRWRKIERSHPEAHAALQRAAEAVFERTEEPVRAEGPEANLRAATELGLLASTDQGVSFVDPDVRRDYLIRHAARTALSTWGDIPRFADVIADFERRTSRYYSGRREMSASVLLVLAREHGKDVVGLMGELARSALKDGRPGRNFWNLYSPFCRALPELEVEPSELATTLAAVSGATANDGTAGFVHDAVQKLAARSRADGDALYGAFLTHPDSPLFNFVPAVLVGLANSDMDEAHRRALELSMAGESAARRVGIEALGLLDYSDANHGRLLEATWERLEQGRSSPDPEVNDALARAYGNLLDQRPEAAQALVDLSTRPDPAVQGQVSLVMFQKADEAFGEQWFKELLLNLAVVSTSHKGVLTNLDHSLYRVAREDPGLAVEVIEAMVLGGDYGEDPEKDKLPEMLPGAFAELVQHHPGALEEAVTRWFVSSERRLHSAAREVVHDTYDISGRREPWLRLSKQVLDGLEEQTIVHALQRIMGHVMGSRALAALLLSAARRERCSREFLAFITGALGNYVLRNYPHEAGDYLRRRLETDDTTGAEAEVARAALDQSDAYLAALDDLPILKEFQPSSQHLYLLRLAEYRQRSGMMDTAKQSSVLLNLMPELPLKYGRSHFTERDGGFTEPSELVPFSISAEKPRVEILDPVGQALQRAAWRSAGLRLDEGDASSGGESENADEGAGR